jgi:hypothetical protein
LKEQTASYTHFPGKIEVVRQGTNAVLVVQPYLPAAIVAPNLCKRGFTGFFGKIGRNFRLSANL